MACWDSSCRRLRKGRLLGPGRVWNAETQSPFWRPGLQQAKGMGHSSLQAPSVGWGFLGTPKPFRPAFFLTPQEHTSQGKRRWPVGTGAFWPSSTCPRGGSPSPQIKFQGEWGGVCFMGTPPSPSTCGTTGKGLWHLPDCWSAFRCSVYLMPRHGLLISHGMLHPCLLILGQN